MSHRLKDIQFKKVEFLLSVADIEQFPVDKFDIAIVGRSNVGKSSLINHLLQRKSIAKVSQKPGKTQLLNFFLIDDLFYLVDLPGYGYAKVAKKEIERWSESIDTYFEERKSLKLVLFLLDLRREPSKEDLAFLEWTTFNKIPIIVVLTKKDKLKRNEVIKQKKMIEESLQLESDEVVLYSIKEADSRKELIEKIKRKV